MTAPIKPALADLVRDEAVIVALGANDKGRHDSCQSGLEDALRYLGEAGVQVLARSSWWCSAAWPDPADPPFLNGVALIRADRSATDLMRLLSRIEDDLGRRRTVRNAPRTLDLDLVAYGRLCGDFDGVLLPHPRAADRLFVMGPLAEILPDWVHPVNGQTAETLSKIATVGRDAHPLDG